MGCGQSSNANSKGERKLIKTLLLHRHGARAPCESDLEMFDTEVNRSKPDSPLTEWKTEELEKLSPTGMQQLETLGKWYADVYIKKMHPEFAEEKNFVWRSSKIERVILSGQQFWKGFSETLGVEKPKDPTPFSDAEDPDSYFRTWNSKEYQDAKKAVNESDEFVEKAKQEYEFLRDLCKIGGIETEGKKPSELLAYVPAIKQMFDVEMYSDRRAFTNMVPRESIRRIDEIARWVWTRHFFTQKFGEMLGNKLLREIVIELGNEKPRFAVFSAHDYNVLALLSALGQREYPDGNCVGFATCLIFEVFIDEKGKKIVEITLNDPFEDKEFKATTDVQNNPVKNWKWEYYHNGCDIQELTKRFAN